VVQRQWVNTRLAASTQFSRNFAPTNFRHPFMSVLRVDERPLKNKK